MIFNQPPPPPVRISASSATTMVNEVYDAEGDELRPGDRVIFDNRPHFVHEIVWKVDGLVRVQARIVDDEGVESWVQSADGRVFYCLSRLPPDKALREICGC